MKMPACTWDHRRSCTFFSFRPWRRTRSRCSSCCCATPRARARRSWQCSTGRPSPRTPLTARTAVFGSPKCSDARFRSVAKRNSWSIAANIRERSRSAQRPGPLRASLALCPSTSRSSPRPLHFGRGQLHSPAFGGDKPSDLEMAPRRREIEAHVER